MMMTQNRLSRRGLLRGLGVALAIPSFESVAPRLSLGAAPITSSAKPLRMAAIFVPNGVHVPDWVPTRQGYGYEMPYILQPLAAVRDDLLVLSGLTHDKGRDNGDGPGDHARSASVFLTGSQPRKTDGANIRSGISVDQYAAKMVGGATRLPSLELGCEAGRGAGNCDSGYSCAYSSNISWASETTPVGKEVNPRSAFERMFATPESGEARRGREQRVAMRKSILDYVADDAKKLQDSLGRSDKRKLDEYLNGVRQVERQIEHSERETTGDVAAEMRIPEGVPQEYADHIRLMLDLMVIAFQTDSTRIATMMFANAGSNRNYREIGIPDGHHDLSHHAGDPVKHAKIRDINRFHVSQLAYFLQKLKSIPEGNGTLLDNCMVLYGSGLSDGNRHNNENLPVLLAGRGGGTIHPGRHVAYSTETPLCNLFLSMLDRMGAPAPYIGDSTGKLSGLQV
jgi:hypothetical protein